MADSITSFEVYRSATSENGPWTLLETLLETPTSHPRSYADSTNPNPRLWYKLVGRTAEGLGGDDGIPYNVVTIGSAAWNKVIGGAASQSGQSVAIAPDGNIIVVGTFAGTVDFTGNGTGKSNVSILTSAGGYDLFIAKYSQTGSLIWVKRYGKTLSETVMAMAVDTAGNIFMGGALYGTCNYGGSDLTSAGDADPWLAKYDSNGNHVWSISFLQSPRPSSYVISIAADSQGNVYVTGSFQGGDWLSPLPINNGKALYSEYNSVDAFLIKFDANGVCQWAKNFVNYGSQEAGTSVAVDRNDNVVVGGYSVSGVSLGGSDLPPGGYIGKFDPSGNHVWSRACGTYENTYASAKIHGMTVSPNGNGNIYITGYFPAPSSDFGGGPISGGSRDASLFIAKYNANGDYQWAKPMTGNYAYAWGMNCTADANDDVIFCGFFRGNNLAFGNTSLSSASLEVDNGYIAKYSSAGNPIWAKGLRGLGYSRFNTVKITDQNQILTVGSFSENHTFNGQSLTSAGESDILLAKILPTG